MNHSNVGRRILITGAAGRVGTAFWQDASAHYELILADKDVTSLSQAPHSVQQLDILDVQACLKACQKVDTILHLAANPNPDADFASLLAVNIQGTYNIFQAASAAGCRRVVFASSAQTIEGYPLDVQVTPQMPVRPKNLYGVTKCFGEALAMYFAYQKGLSSIAVRIACFEQFTEGRAETARDMSAYISRRDLVHLLNQCIETSLVEPFAIAHGISNNRFKRLDLTSTQAQLTYFPEDDAFQTLKMGLTD